MIAAGDQQSTGHDCARHCCKESCFDGKCSSCPYAQTWHTDAMLQINKFEVVLETFHPRNLLHEDFSADRNRLYLQFSFNNVETMISKPDCKQQSKQQTTFSGNGKEKSKGLNVEANASLDKRGNGFMCKIIFAVRICEVAALRRVQEELCYPCGVEIKIVALYRNDVQKSTGNKSFTSERIDSSCLNISEFLSVFKLQGKTAALKLVQRNLCWSQFLHAGCFYVITETVPDEKSSRILQNGNLQALISVSSDMLLERICWCEKCGLAPSKDAQRSREIVKALDELKNDFLKTDRLHTVDTVLSDASYKGDEGDKSLKPRYKCFSLIILLKQCYFAAGIFGSDLELQAHYHMLGKRELLSYFSTREFFRTREKCIKKHKAQSNVCCNAGVFR